MRITLFLLLALSLSFHPSSVSAQQLQKGAIYELDSYHSLLDFTARHQGFGRVRGTFNEYRASMYFVPGQLEASSVTAVIEVASLDTQNPGRDDHLKKVFFDVDSFPRIHFQSSKIVKEEGQYIMYGALKIKDVTKEVVLPLEVLTLDGVDQWENQRIVLESSIQINRRDFNVVYSNRFWDGIVSDEIQIDISFGGSAYNANNSIFPWRKNSIGTFIKNGVEKEGLKETIRKVRLLKREQSEDYKFEIDHFYRIGLALAQSGQTKEGLAILNLGIELNHADISKEEIADQYACIAEIHLKNQQIKKAQEIILTALQNDPWNPTALELKRQIK